MTEGVDALTIGVFGLEYYEVLEVLDGVSKLLITIRLLRLLGHCLICIIAHTFFSRSS
ncbi:hypothetical protein GYMLUDRAFT_872988 [Collybiopsis luxurians FD-317 M1]|nr:hypothetical protein GYMLUDRAFT_872988 [Collybiopsis luxurians FD-317 M1]